MLDTLTDSLILSILKCLPPTDVARVGQCSSTLRRVCQDELLWRTLFHRHFRISPFFPQPVAYDSWRAEFIRLIDETPLVEAEVLTKHTDQVLHVSFSNDGQRFATTSKDAFVHVWNSTHPVVLEYSYNMKKFSWKYTQFSQFNESDTLLLVSGVLFGLQSTSGEIVVFSLTDGFNLCCRVVNKPYDVFGNWYSDTYLFSGDLHWLGQLVSKSVIWLNKASQEIESEHTAVMNQVFRFYNPKASSIRSLLVANCVDSPAPPEISDSEQPCSSKSITRDRSWDNSSRQMGNPPSSHVLAGGPLEQDLRRINSRGLRATLQGAFQNWRPLDNIANIDYTQDYHRVREEGKEKQSRDEFQPMEVDTVDYAQVAPSPSKLTLTGVDEEAEDSQDTTEQNTYVPNREMDDEEVETEGDEEDTSEEGDDDLQVTKLNKFYSCLSSSSGESSNVSTPESKNEGPCRTKPVELDTEDVIDPREKWLIFTCGSQTYTPHQIGFKKVKPFKFKSRLDPGPSLQDRIVEFKRKKMLEQHGMDDEDPVDYADFPSVAHRFDTMDHVIDLHGHIIGMTLSPDHRHLYVNSRPWPSGYTISDPLQPPPIAQEIDIHVIDLVTLKQVGMMRRAHRAYTPNEECFFIFLDASEYYLASGAEDKHGYMWDRHYGISLCKLPHTDVVNCVAFNPKDSQMLVTVSDDQTIKIWRSKAQCREHGINAATRPQGTRLFTKPKYPPRQSHSI